MSKCKQNLQNLRQLRGMIAELKMKAKLLKLTDPNVSMKMGDLENELNAINLAIDTHRRQ